MPLGAPSLCPDSVRSAMGRSRRSTGTLPNACTPSEWSGTPAATQRAAISAIGCSEPTSLLTHITDTTAGLRASAASSASRRSAPLASTGRMISSPPSVATVCAAARIALCSMAETATRRGRPRAAAANADPMMARLSASVPPEVNTTCVGSHPTASAMSRRACSRPARAARPKRWELDGLPKISPRYGTHGLANFGADRRGGGVIEVGQGRFHKA